MEFISAQARACVAYLPFLPMRRKDYPSLCRPSSNRATFDFASGTALLRPHDLLAGYSELLLLNIYHYSGRPYAII